MSATSDKNKSLSPKALPASLQRNVDLLPFNTLGVSCSADYYWPVESEQELLAAVAWYRAQSMPLLVLGGGSNVILPERFPGLVLHQLEQGFELISSDENERIIKIRAGQNWHQLVDDCCAAGYHGLENLALIPGTVGAAPIQNIGAYGVELKDVFVSLSAINLESGERETLNAEACQFAYRESIFKDPAAPRRIIDEVTLKLHTSSQTNCQYPGVQQQLQGQTISGQTISGQTISGQNISPRQLFDAICRLRQEKLPDPKELANVGSFFKNPIISAQDFDALQAKYPDVVNYPHGADIKLAAGWLIDQAGWKGKREAKVGVHEKQALVLVNHGQASGADVLEFAAKIQADIEQRFGVQLEIEPRQIQALLTDNVLS